MDPLLIHYKDEATGWVAAVANTDICYRFVVNEITGNQIVSVENLANAMMHGSAVLVEEAENILEVPRWLGAEEVIGDLFCTTNQLILSGELIFDTLGEDALIDVLEEVGEALVEAFVK